LLCSFDSAAEQQCEVAINKSLALDPQSVESRQTLASLRISQCRKDDAICVLNELFPAVSAAIKEFRSRNIMDDIAGVDADSKRVECELLFAFLLSLFLYMFILLYSTSLTGDLCELGEVVYGVQQFKPGTILRCECTV
jgi:hypothetical protein